MNSEVLFRFQVKAAGRKRWMVHCRCFCGNEFDCREEHFKSGETTSCGCYQKQRTIEASTTHGKTGSPEYRIWAGIMERCYKPYSSIFQYYGGKGITVYAPWHKFENFLAYLTSTIGRCPPGMSIDRIKSSGNYEPGNIRWADYLTQQNNRSSNRRVTWDGQSLTLAQWERRLGLPAGRVAARLNRDHWSVERALTTPV